jgi:glycosyltransferase involved in cell wall biosynthesis
VSGKILDEDLLAATRTPLSDDVPQVSYDQADLFYSAHPGFKAGFTMLEVDGLPAEWVKACNRMDEIWVPSTWGADVFRASGVRRPVRVMPLGFDPARFRPGLPARKVRGRFTFLSVFEWGERKAPEILLRAWAAAFDEDDPVLLLLRVNNFDGSVDVAAQIAALSLPDRTAPVALLHNQQIPSAELGSLYCSADCFILASRGEGWGMPVLEAMACGLPVIATGWGGTTEFFNDQVGYPLAVRRLVLAEAKCPYYAGHRWAEPDQDHLAELFRYVFANQEEASRRGRFAAEAALSRWTWVMAAQRIVDRLREVGT